MHARPLFALGLALALGLAACQPPVQPLDEAAFRDLLRANGLDDPYAGAAKSGLFWNELLWRRALATGRPSPEVTAQTFYRRGEPMWADAGWERLTAGIESALRARGWDTTDPEERVGQATGDEYVRVWAGPDQRLAVARFTFETDSTGYFVTAALVGPDE